MNEERNLFVVALQMFLCIEIIELAYKNYLPIAGGEDSEEFTTMDRLEAMFK